MALGNRPSAKEDLLAPGSKGLSVTRETEGRVAFQHSCSVPATGPKASHGGLREAHANL